MAATARLTVAGVTFRHRREAGRILASLLNPYAHRSDVVVLGLPRGGVPVAYEVAVALDAPLDLLVVRKLGVPGREELAMGALAGDTVVLNDHVVGLLSIPDEAIAAVVAAERRELKRREQVYRGDRPALAVEGEVVILVDDGLATGSSMRAAVVALRDRRPARIVVAVPTAARQTCEQLAADVDELVCASNPSPFLAVGQWYDDFSQTTDEEVRTLLAEAPPGVAAAP